jgi:type IV pilus assembly protein PilY1
MRWNVGLDNGTIYHRCRSPGSSTCSLIGDVYHSTPKLVGRPSELLRDETYQTFAERKATRPLVLYTSTNDGFLHAFKVAPGDKTDQFKVNSPDNNELWAFIPPAVLPAIPSQYPGTHQLLLDGIPVVKDVAAREASGRWIYDRSSSAASTDWRTVLVQSFGGTRGGYFALDITNPVPAAGNVSPNDPTTVGPKFLWQLTTDDAGNPLFGTQGGTPLITSLFFTENSVEKEVAVAVLPGGNGGIASGSCTRVQPNPPDMAPGYSPRTAVPCYSGQGIGARSLTIVRLDSGEIIRTFRRDPLEVQAALRGRVNTAPIDSPITGQPAAFPGDTGAIADRLYIGDRDGTMWRVDLSATNPANWTMRLFFDAFWDKTASDGQPIPAEPILSVDAIGSITIAFATGDQEVLTAPAGMTNRVVSLTEKLNTGGTAYGPKLNWHQTFSNGERVAGPMSLFTGSLFFSTFKPEPETSTNVCLPGVSRVWGMHYVSPNSAALNDGGKARLPRDASANPALVQMIDTSSALFNEGAVIFGVGVAQLPTCLEEGASTSDPYFGGSYSNISSVQPGKFQLVMHTGNTGSAVPGGRTNVLTLPLTSPSMTPRIDSWAALTE